MHKTACIWLITRMEATNSITTKMPISPMLCDQRGIRYATYAYDDNGRVRLTEHAGGVGK